MRANNYVDFCDGLAWVEAPGSIRIFKVLLRRGRLRLQGNTLVGSTADSLAEVHCY